MGHVPEHTSSNGSPSAGAGSAPGAEASSARQRHTLRSLDYASGVAALSPSLQQVQLKGTAQAPAKDVYAAELQVLLGKLRALSEKVAGMENAKSGIASPDHQGFDFNRTRLRWIEAFFKKYPQLTRDDSVVRMLSAAMGTDGWQLTGSVLMSMRKKGHTVTAGEIAVLHAARATRTSKHAKYTQAERQKYKNTALQAELRYPNDNVAVVYLHGFGIGKAGGEAEIKKATTDALKPKLPTALKTGASLYFNARGFEDGVGSKSIFHGARTQAGLKGAIEGMVELPQLHGKVVPNGNMNNIGVIPAVAERAMWMLSESGRARLRGVALQFILHKDVFTSKGQKDRSRADILLQGGGIRAALKSLASSRAKQGAAGAISQELAFIFDKLTKVQEGSIGDRFFSTYDFNAYEGHGGGRGYAALKGLTKQMTANTYALNFGSSCWGQIRAWVGQEKDPTAIAEKAAAALWHIRSEMMIVAFKAEQRSGLGGGSPVFDWINKQRKSGNSIYNFLKKTTKLM